MIAAFEEFLLRLKEQDRHLYKDSYYTDYLDYIYLDKLGIESSRDISHSNFRLFSKDINCGESAITLRQPSFG